MKILFTLILILSSICEVSFSKQPTIDQFVDYVKDMNIPDSQLTSLLTQGEMQGYYKLSYIWELYEKLCEDYPQFVSKKVKIGNTYLGKDINVFYIGKNIGSQKNYFYILFNFFNLMSNQKKEKKTKI